MFVSRLEVEEISLSILFRLLRELWDAEEGIDPLAITTDDKGGGIVLVGFIASDFEASCLENLGIAIQNYALQQRLLERLFLFISSK